VRASSSVTVSEEGERATLAATPSRPIPGTARSAVPKPAARQRPVASPPGEGQMEISIQEDADLAELAKQIERRTP
jgi:hypothetical protein